jgi:hypothetical protein
MRPLREGSFAQPEGVINYPVIPGRCKTNQAEEYFSRLRRAEIGIHHHIAGAYLLSRRNRHGERTTAASRMGSGEPRSGAGDEARLERGLYGILAAE